MAINLSRSACAIILATILSRFSRLRCTCVRIMLNGSVATGGGTCIAVCMACTRLGFRVQGFRG